MKVGTPRCGVPAPCRRGTGASPRDQFVALGTECSAAERGGGGAARHPYLGFVATGSKQPFERFVLSHTHLMCGATIAQPGRSMLHTLDRRFVEERALRTTSRRS